MVKLLDLEEMEKRHEKGEDPFALAIEKWERIRDFLLEKETRGATRKLSNAAPPR